MSFGHPLDFSLWISGYLFSAFNGELLIFILSKNLVEYLLNSLLTDRMFPFFENIVINHSTVDLLLFFTTTNGSTLGTVHVHP